MSLSEEDRKTIRYQIQELQKKLHRNPVSIGNQIRTLEEMLNGCDTRESETNKLERSPRGPVFEDATIAAKYPIPSPPSQKGNLIAPSSANETEPPSSSAFMSSPLTSEAPETLTPRPVPSPSSPILTPRPVPTPSSPTRSPLPVLEVPIPIPIPVESNFFVGGALPSPPDGRDFRFEDLVGGNQIHLRTVPFITGHGGKLMMEIPDSVDLRDRFREIRDQERSSTCVAFASTSIQEYFNSQDNGLQEYLSPQFVYNLRTPKQEGMFCRDAAKILAEFGSPREPLYPFKSEGGIGSKIYKDAKSFRISSYARVSDIEGVKIALAGGLPMIFAMPASKEEAFWRGKAKDGHCVVIVGFNREGLIIRNSWGKGWMDSGYGIMPYEDFENLEWREIWTFVDFKDSTPVKRLEKKKRCGCL